MVLATLTWRQTHVFKDHETLWQDTIRKDPSSWMGHTSLGALLERRGALVEAERHYREAVQLNPDFGIARHDLGALLANQGRFKEAIPEMREAVRLLPASLDPHVNLARALLLADQPDEAVTWLRRAAALWPDVPQVRALLDQALTARANKSTAPTPASPERRPPNGAGVSTK